MLGRWALPDFNRDFEATAICAGEDLWKWLNLPVIEHSSVKKTTRGSPFGIVIPLLNIHLLYETRLAGRYGISMYITWIWVV